MLGIKKPYEVVKKRNRQFVHYQIIGPCIFAKSSIMPDIDLDMLKHYADITSFSLYKILLFSINFNAVK